MTLRDFRELLKSVNRSYDDFVSLVITFVKMPGNKSKAVLIKNYIHSHPHADSSDVLEYMINELGLVTSIDVQQRVAI